jgi:hypothetical protein
MQMTYEELGGDQAGFHVEAELRADYELAEQPFDSIGAWFARVWYDTVRAESLDYALSINRQAWRAVLAERRTRQGLPAVTWPEECPPTT